MASHTQSKATKKAKAKVDDTDRRIWLKQLVFDWSNAWSDAMATGRRRAEVDEADSYERLLHPLFKDAFSHIENHEYSYFSADQDPSRDAPFVLYLMADEANDEDAETATELLVDQIDNASPPQIAAYAAYAAAYMEHGG